MSLYFGRLTKEEFDPYIAQVELMNQKPEQTQASVVIVAYHTNQALIKCLASLQNQTFTEFDIILVDNGRNNSVINEIRKFSLLYIRLWENYRPSLARNIGIAYARGDLVCFLDDDALAGPEYVAEHLLAHRQPGVLGVRGKILPKTSSLYNRVAYIYDLGEAAIPSYIDLEGNASFSRHALEAIDGFNPTVFAGEGAELSYRLVQRFSEKRNLIYWPGAVIYHDYASSVKKYLSKTLRGAKMHVYLERLHPDFWEFIESYQPLPQGEIPRPRNLSERIELALIRRAGKLIRNIGLRWYRR
jgi:GT2 family glycosyltransferase